MRDMFVCALSSSHRTCYKCHARATSRRRNTHNLPFIESTTNTLLMTILNNVFSLFCICVVYTLGTLVRCDACRVHVVCMWHVLECEKSMSVHYIVVYESSLDSEYVRHTSECAAAAAGACEWVWACIQQQLTVPSQRGSSFLNFIINKSNLRVHAPSLKWHTETRPREHWIAFTILNCIQNEHICRATTTHDYCMCARPPCE